MWQALPAIDYCSFLFLVLLGFFSTKKCSGHDHYSSYTSAMYIHAGSGSSIVIANFTSIHIVHWGGGGSSGLYPFFRKCTLVDYTWHTTVQSRTSCPRVAIFLKILVRTSHSCTLLSSDLCRALPKVVCSWNIPVKRSTSPDGKRRRCSHSVPVRFLDHSEWARSFATLKLHIPICHLHAANKFWSHA